MCELGGQPLYRSMAEDFAACQMLHLHNKLRVAPLNIRAGLIPTSQAIPANSEDQRVKKRRVVGSISSTPLGAIDLL